MTTPSRPSQSEAPGGISSDPRIKCCLGGSSRAQTVLNALRAVDATIDWVAVHDAARPLVSQDLINRTLEAALQHGAAVPAMRVHLTIKQATGPLPARVIRAQVLSLKARPFVWAARAAGAGHARILVREILPNVLPLSFLYMAIGVQTGVMLEAALSFLGFGDPNVQSWGIMLNAAFRAGAMRSAWWWVLPPGLALSIFVIAVFMITRAFEERLNPQLRAI